MIRLTFGDWSAEVRPELGGALTSLTFKGGSIFRPTPPGTLDVLQTACFPLVPYANRIANGVFRFDGRQVQLEALEAFAPHSLHGDGWRTPWEVVGRTTSRLELAMSWPGGDRGWPWAWSARQWIELSADGLSIRLSITNEGGEVMPSGLGLHPYFYRSPGLKLRLAADGVWQTEGDIPTTLGEPDRVLDWSRSVTLDDAPFVDHAYSGWGGEAILHDQERAVVIKAGSNARWVQVFSPKGEDFVCVEPVTHRPDALNAPQGEDSGLHLLGPKETQSLSMTIGLGDLDQL